MLLAAALALVPLVLATIAFGHAFRASENDRADSRLADASRLALRRIGAGGEAGTRAAAVVAALPSVQLALARGDLQTVHALVYRKGDVTVTVRSDSEHAAPAPPNALVRSAAVVNGGVVLGHVVATVRLAHSLRELGATTHTELVLARGGSVQSGSLRGWQLRGPAGQPVPTNVRGDGYRILRESVEPGVQLVALVSDRTIAATVRHRQLVTLGAAVLTLAALAIAVFLVAQRRRPSFGRGNRSPVALVGDVVANAHDPRALLPVILETAVAAMNAAGGKVVWDGERIATIGEPTGTPNDRLVFSLDEADEHGEERRLIVLYPRRGGFTQADREVADALVAQGRIALENARLHSVVRRQAVTDELTDLANRRRFMEVLQQEVARSARFGTSLALALCDLDHFKQINDQYGHQAGDNVLRSAADVIRARVRETDLPARIGGEEFAIILSGTDLEGAFALAEQLRHDLSLSVRVLPDEWVVTASFGVAVLHEGESAELLIGTADRALYRAKAEGRNRVCAAKAEPSAA